MSSAVAKKSDALGGYKQTELGLIPEDWMIFPITALLEKSTRITYGVVQPGGNDPNGVLFIRGGDILSGKVLHSQLRRIPKTISDQYSRTVLHGGEIVISLVGYPGETALVPYWLSGANIARQVALVQVSDESPVAREYLATFLQSPAGRNTLLKEAIGSAQKVINLRDINRITIIAPPTKAEQETITKALSDADALIESLERLIGKKRQIKQGAMQDLLTGKKRLAGFSKEWGSKTFGEVFDFHPTATNARADLGDDGNAYYIHYGDIHTRFHSHLNLASKKPSKIDRQKCKNAALVKNGDWIMADASEDYDGVGKSIEVLGIGSNEAVVSGLHTFLLREKTPTFVEGFKGHLGNSELLRKQYLRVMTGMKVFGVSKAALRNLDLPVPEENEQRAIVQILNEMDAQIAGIETKLEKAKQLKQGMMQDLLTGKVRLV